MDKLFQFDPGLSIWTWIAFAALFYILKRYAFPTLLGTLKERESMIAKAIDDARAVEQELANADVEKTRIIEKAREEADQIVRRAREEAESLRRRLTAEAEMEAEAIAEDARLRMAEERAAAMTAMQDDIAGMVCQASEHVIGKSLIGEKERAWAKELLEQL